ncbi:hypothetical protein [uncultured Sphingomonas sp.]|uniref:hypothetical protein n=1 Tax=uncultured Sphingomonas sp. TaxID=158754 RepID=UPI0035C9542B
MLHHLFPFAPANQPVWAWTKAWLGLTLGASDDTLHMTTGLLILTLAALVLRRPPWSLLPWMAVLIAETLNEAYDLTHGTDEGNWRDSWHDFWLTLLWPTVVLLIWRHFATRERGESENSRKSEF